MHVLQRRTSGDEPKKVEWPAAKNGPVVQKELNETIVKSREEIEELLETEDRQHLGDISDEVSTPHSLFHTSTPDWLSPICTCPQRIQRHTYGELWTLH